MSAATDLPWGGCTPQPDPADEDAEGSPVPDLVLPAEPVEGLTWCTLRLADRPGMDELQGFLRDHYVCGSRFRLHYTADLLRAALLAPGHKPRWHVGLRAEDGALAGCITATPHRSTVRGREVDVAVVNFLCVRGDRRQRQLAAALVREVTRRIDERGGFHAVFTSSTHGLPSATEVQYRFAPLDGEYLRGIGFLPAGRGDEVARALKRVRPLPEIELYDPGREDHLRDLAPRLHRAYSESARLESAAVHLTLAQFRHLAGSPAVTLLYHRDTLDMALFFRLDSAPRSPHAGSGIRALYLLLWARSPLPRGRSQRALSDYRFFIALLHALKRRRPGVHLVHTLGHEHSLLVPAASALRFCTYNVPPAAPGHPDTSHRFLLAF